MLHAWPELALDDTHHKISWKSVCPPPTHVPLPLLRSCPESVDGSVAALATTFGKRRGGEAEVEGGEGRVGEEGSGSSLPVAARVLGSAEYAVAQGPRRWLLQRRKNIQADSGSEQEQGVLRDWQSLSARLPSIKRSKWKAAVQKAKECEEKHVEQKRIIPVTQLSKIQIGGICPKEAEEEPPRTKSPPKILESPKPDEKMAWRRNYYLRSRSPTPPAQPLASKTDLAEPNWVKVLGSSATQVWSMVKTFRERGNHEIAASLEAAAEKQAEAVLRTQQINVRAKPTSSTLPVQPKPVVSREPTPIKSPVRVRVRRSAPSSPVPAPAMDEEEKRSSRAESEWESEEEDTSTSASTRPPSGDDFPSILSRGKIFVIA